MIDDEPTEFDRLTPHTPEKCLEKRPLQRVTTLSEDTLYRLDAIFSSLVVAPSMVGHWRGTWMLIDNYGEYFPYIQSFIISTVLVTVIGVLRPVFTEYLSPAKYYRVFRVCYTYVCSVLGILQWRCYWVIVDNMFTIEYDDATGAMISVSVRRVLVCLIGSLMLLFWLKSIINVIGSPFTISLDDIEPFQFPTRFKKDILVQKTSLYILDCLFSVLIVGTLVVFVWRGAWVLVDIYLFPENEVWSSWASLALGYMIVAIAFLLQPIMMWLCDRLNGALRLVAADLFLLFSLIGTVNVWRGIWNLLNIYFLPDNMELSCWITHWVSLILLILLGCSNSLLVRGVYIDAEEPAGKCVVFPCYYLRLIFQHERDKKNQTCVQLDVPNVKVKQEENDNHVSVSIDTGNHI